MTASTNIESALPCEEHPHTEHIGCEVQGVYDGVLYWVCPYNGWAWPRFTDGLGRLTEIAADYARRADSRRNDNGNRD